MTKERYIESLKQFCDAVERLNEALNDTLDNKLIIDATIQRFEFSFELAWKTIKKILEDEGISDISSPKSSLKAAYKNNLIDDEESWLQMLEDRNLTSHTYKQQLATEIFERIKKYQPILKKLSISLVKRYG